MKTTRKIFCLTLCLILCLCAGGFSLAEDALPQLIPATFPEGNYEAPADGKENYAASPEGFSNDGASYHDDSLDVQLYHIRVHDTDTFVAFVQIAHASQLRAELARKFPSKDTVRPTLIARKVNAVLAMNSDWFTYHGSGIIYRNGELLRSEPDPEMDGLVIDENGDFHIMRPMTEEAYAALEVPIAQALAFGPALVIDGEVQEFPDRQITYAQRMAIGQVGPLSYVAVATDGDKQKDSVGMTVPQLAQLMKDLGAVNAYNLDGGQSTSLIMNGEKVNADPQTMRAVGDILYFVTAIE